MQLQAAALGGWPQGPLPTHSCGPPTTASAGAGACRSPRKMSNDFEGSTRLPLQPALPKSLPGKALHMVQVALPLMCMSCTLTDQPCSSQILVRYQLPVQNRALECKSTLYLAFLGWASDGEHCAAVVNRRSGADFSSPLPSLCHAVQLRFEVDAQSLLDEAGLCCSRCESMLAAMVQEPPGEDD